MAKLTKSLSIFKERTCSVSIVLDTRTNKKNVTEYPLSIRFTIDRKFFYYPVGGSYSEKRFSDICNAAKSNSENYRIQKEWKETFVPKFKVLLESLNKGGLLTYEMVRSAVTTGKSDITDSIKENSFFNIGKQSSMN